MIEHVLNGGDQMRRQGTIRFQSPRGRQKGLGTAAEAGALELNQGARES